MPRRRSRRRILGKRELFEQEKREDELRELERAMHRERLRHRRTAGSGDSTAEHDTDPDGSE